MLALMRAVTCVKHSSNHLAGSIDAVKRGRSHACRISPDGVMTHSSAEFPGGLGTLVVTIIGLTTKLPVAGYSRCTVGASRVRCADAKVA